MYLARFQHGPGFDVRQGAVALTPPAPFDRRAPDWWATLERLVGAWRAHDVAGFGLRVTFDPGGTLAQTLLVAAPAGRAAALRQYLGSFTRLTLAADGSVALPPAREAYDARLDGFPRWRFASAPRVPWNGAWLACDCAFGPVLDDLLVQASTRGVRLGYQVNVRPAAPGAEHRRQARHAALAVAYTRGVPRGLADEQERLARALDGVTALQDEVLGVDTEEHARWLADALARAFRPRRGALGFTPQFAPHPDAHERALLTPAFPLDRLTADDPDDAAADVPTLCARGLDARTAVARLTWRPSPELRRFLPPLPPERPDEPAATSGWDAHPPPVDVGRPYVFLSYARRDADRVAPLVALAREQGVPVWYDTQTRTGDDWLRTIDERLRGSAVVLLAATGNAVGSKWVEVELVHARNHDLPIVPAQLGTVPSDNWMGLFLATTQRCEADSAEGRQHLVRELRRHLA